MSSVAKFIRYPIETNPTTLAEAVYAYIQARAPLWSPNDGNLDVWIIQALTAIMAENRELASDVPTNIFRWYGSTLIGLPPLTAAPSTITSTWTAIDNAGHTIPDGTQVGILDAAGNLVPFETVGATIIPSGSTATGAGAVTLRSVSPGVATAGLGGVGVAVQLLDVLDFIVSVTITGVTTGGVDDEADDAYLDRLATRLRLLSTRPILTSDFATLARDVIGVQRAVAVDGYNPFHNMLTANQASLETDTTGWIAGANTTIARSTSQASDGAASLSLTSTAAGSVAAQTTPGNLAALAVVPGETITAIGRSRAATVARSSRLEIDWLQSDGATVISTLQGAAANNATGAWTDYTVSGVAPGNAAFARLRVVNLATAAAAEVHYWDRLSWRHGSTTDWVAGGTSPTGNARMVTVAAVDSQGNSVSGPLKTAIQNLLDGNREVNFIVNMLDPNRTQIDVNYAAKALAGFDTVAVKAAIDANLTSYINAASWGTEASGDPRDWVERSVLRYSDVAAIISNTEGVDYWTTLTIGIHGSTLAAADVNLVSPASLAVLNTITGAVS